MKVFGILSISNGVGLQYPFGLVVHNLHRLCDEVILGLDPVFPADKKLVKGWELPNLTVIDAPWDLENRSGGTEIALQMDKLVGVAKDKGADWVVVLQADELLHDKDFSMLRTFMERKETVDGFSMERLYFWQDLKIIRKDWNAEMVRIFRPGTYSFLADGATKDGMTTGKISAGGEMKLPFKIYHYSRIGNPKTISKRIRNLDALFHPEENLIEEDKLPDYDFKTREFDNYSKNENPPEVEGVFETYTGTHPSSVKEYFNNG